MIFIYIEISIPKKYLYLTEELVRILLNNIVEVNIRGEGT